MYLNPIENNNSSNFINQKRSEAIKLNNNSIHLNFNNIKLQNGNSSQNMSNSNQNHSLSNSSDDIIVKMLVPAYATGSIIGKQGQTISQLQQQTGISIKLSKSKDFYPGTMERVCLIRGQRSVPDEAIPKEDVGPLAVNNVIQFIINKVIEFPLPKEMMIQNQNYAERSKQVKIIVPNSTAGLIIGKKGTTIKQIMETTNAKIQMTQKPDSRSNMHMQPLLERVITICGESKDQLFQAVDMILEKIREDPQSGSCPNLSYQNVTGLIANANPVGSPYAPVNETQLMSAANGLTLASASLLKFSVNQSHHGLTAGQLPLGAHHQTAALNFNQAMAQHHHNNHHHNNGISGAQLMNFTNLSHHNANLSVASFPSTHHHLPVSAAASGLTVNGQIPLVLNLTGRPNHQNNHHQTSNNALNSSHQNNFSSQNRTIKLEFQQPGQVQNNENNNQANNNGQVQQI